MAPGERLVADLAGAILDGSPIDWASAETGADEECRLLLGELRLLAAVADLHRIPPASAPCIAPGLLAARTPAAAEDDDVLHQWGHLRLLERIGGGAFGDVYRAWDTRLDREVALKLLPARPTTDDPHGLSIIEEGRLLARVRHPNVVTLYGADRIGDRIGLWMELVKGRTLQQAIESRQNISATAAVAIGIELCGAVAAVHAAGLLHRDIKPHNVMQAEDGRVVLMDFGTGRELDSSDAALAGTPLYLAPELLSGEPATVRSDVYSLGVVLYRLTTGAYPVEADSLAGLRRAHESHAKPAMRSVRRGVPARLARVIERAIHPQPERRHPSAEALAADLRAVSRRPNIVKLASVMAVAAALAVAAWIGWTGKPEPTAPTVRADIQLPAPLSIAVLPFKPLVGTQADERSALGVTEAFISGLVSGLGRGRTLRIKPIARADLHGAGDIDVARLGRSLGVDVVIEGYYHKTETGIKSVGGRMWRTRGGTGWAADPSHETFSSVLELQRRFAESNADGVGKLRSSERSPVTAPETSSPDAYQHYLFGRHHLEQRNLQQMKLAEHEFREALKLDPRYALARAALSVALTHSAWLGGPTGIATMGPAKDAALQAIATDESVALGHTALAYVLECFEYDHFGAQAEHLRAMALDSQDLWVLRAYASFLMRRGAFDEALDVLRRALALDPTSPLSNRHYAMTLFAARRYDECVAVSRRTLTLDPANLTLSNGWLGLCLEQQGKQAEAVEAWEKGRAAHGESQVAARMTQVYAARGWEAYWRERLRLAVARTSTTHPTSVGVAAAYVRLGQIDQAVQSFERLRELRDPEIGFAIHPQWDPLRSAPRFRALQARLGQTAEVQAELAKARRAPAAATR